MYSRQYLNSLYSNERRKAEDAVINQAIISIRNQVLDRAKDGNTVYHWDYPEQLTHRQYVEISKGLYTWFNNDVSIVRKLNGFFIDWRS
jgi:hypothetical protein